MQPKTFSTLVAVQARARTLLSRFEIVRQRGRAEGGGATVSTETASLILLRAVGVNHGQFQQLTQPCGFRLPSARQNISRCAAPSDGWGTSWKATATTSLPLCAVEATELETLATTGPIQVVKRMKNPMAPSELRA